MGRCRDSTRVNGRAPHVQRLWPASGCLRRKTPRRIGHAGSRLLRPRGSGLRLSLRSRTRRRRRARRRRLSGRARSGDGDRRRRGRRRRGLRRRRRVPSRRRQPTRPALFDPASPVRRTPSCSRAGFALSLRLPHGGLSALRRQRGRLCGLLRAGWWLLGFGRERGIVRAQAVRALHRGDRDAAAEEEQDGQQRDTTSGTAGLATRLAVPALLTPAEVHRRLEGLGIGGARRLCRRSDRRACVRLALRSAIGLGDRLELGLRERRGRRHGERSRNDPLARRHRPRNVCDACGLSDICDFRGVCKLCHGRRGGAAGADLFDPVPKLALGGLETQAQIRATVAFGDHRVQALLVLGRELPLGSGLQQLRHHRAVVLGPAHAGAGRPLGFDDPLDDLAADGADQTRSVLGAVDRRGSGSLCGGGGEEPSGIAPYRIANVRCLGGPHCSQKVEQRAGSDSG